MLSVVSTPKATGTPVTEHHLLQAARALAGDVLKMRRVAADHAAERHHVRRSCHCNARACTASGSSKAPGTRVPRAAPQALTSGFARHASRAPADQLLDQLGVVARGHHRDTHARWRSARPDSATFVPMHVSISDVAAGLRRRRCRVVDVTDDLQTKGRQTVHVFGRGQYLHAPHAQILEDLRADADGAQHGTVCAPVCVRGGILGAAPIMRTASASSRGDSLCRRITTTPHGRAGDARQRRAQRPGVARVSRTREHVAQRVHEVHAHQRRRRAQSSSAVYQR